MASPSRKILYRLLHRAGFFRAICWLNRRKISILALHGVIDEESDKDWEPLRPQLSTRELRRVLEVLSRTYTFVSLEEAIEMIAGERAVRPNSIAITLDDGYRNNLTCALPVFREFGIKPAFFVPTGFVQSPRPYWFDQFDYVIQKVSSEFTLSLDDIDIHFEPGNRARLASAYASLRRLAKAADWREAKFGRFFETESAKLEKRAGTRLSDIQGDDEFTSIMTPGDLQQVHADRSATIGSHTVNHLRVDKLDIAERRNELRESRQYLEGLLDARCAYFCYPNGSYDDESREDVIDAGYVAAVTSDAGMNSVGDDLYTLKRIAFPRAADAAQLLGRLSGLRFMLARFRLAGSRNA